MLRGAAHPQVGFEDSEMDLTGFIKKYDHMKTTLSLSDLELLMWSSNMLSEQDAMWHYAEGMTIKAFIDRVLRRYRSKYDYETFYNYVFEKKQKGKENGT